MVTETVDRIGAYDTLTEESRRACLQLHPLAVVTPQRYGNETFFHISLESQSKYVRVGYREYVFLSLLDGKTTTARALAESAQALQREALTEQEAGQLIDWLLENRLVSFQSSNSSNVTDAVDAPADSPKEVSWLQKMNPFWMKFPLTKLMKDPNQILDAVLPLLRWCFHPVSIGAMTLIILIGLISATTYFSELRQSAEGWLVADNWIALLVTWVLLKVVHEFAHAMCCRYHGGRVPEAGIVMILLVPMAYVDVTSSWAFRERWKRMAVAAAGMFVELFLATLALLIWFQVESPVMKHHLMNVMLAASLSTILFNANPLMRFDGYFLLSDGLKIPNLYNAGSESVQCLVSWVMYGQDHQGVSVELRQRSWAVRIYGVLAAVWKVLVCISLTLAASAMLGGWGILLAVMGIVSMLGVPAWRLAKGYLRRLRNQRHQAVRASAVSLVGGLALLAMWFYLPNPFPAHVPCVVDYVPSAKVRASTSGFVTSVEVAEGDIVKQGDVLMRIENKSLHSRILAAESELELHRVREKIAIDHREMAAAQMAVEDQTAAEKKLVELRRQANELVIKAPNDGQVIGYRLGERIGTYVEPGEVLMVVGNEHVKEVVFSIATRDCDEFQNWQSFEVPVCFGLNGRYRTTIDRLEPQASERLPHPALGVQYGGPLAMRSVDGDQEPRLARSRFVAKAALATDLGSKLLAGETGTAYLRRPGQTLGAWLWISGRDWLREQVEFVKTAN